MRVCVRVEVCVCACVCACVCVEVCHLITKISYTDKFEIRERANVNK